jgi:hypothetical protein
MNEHDENLLPEQAGDADVASWAYMPEGKPEEFGLPPDATFQQKAVWHRQEMFLEAFRKCGKIGKAAKASGLTRWAAYYWQRDDTFSFNKRLEAAHEDYCESWEQGMDERLEDPKGNRGSDILYMFKMKAEKPGKYREDVKVLGLEPLTALLEEARKLAARDIQGRKQLEAGAAEGEYREMGEKGEG